MENSGTAGFDEFVRLLSAEFEWPPQELTESSRLMEDCGMDSMAMYELLLLLEENGIEVDEESLFGWLTLGDVFLTWNIGRGVAH